MNSNNIDEVIKKGFQESERRNDHLSNLAKARIWNAIEKPKKQGLGQWVLVSAMAASVSLLLISVFLFYKLELKQKELDALKTNREHLLIEIPAENSYTDKSQAESLDRKSEDVPGPKPSDETEQISQLDHAPTLVVKADAKANSRQPVPLPMIEKPEMDIETEITIPEFDHLELNEELVLSGPSDYENIVTTKSKKLGKLKIRIGNGSSSHSHHPSIALNLKL